ncbi:MAG: HPP family protein [Gammaproteobacteria bacterium]|nr:HPP family protein [Gammaproteobacteria bacterium]
MSSRQRPSSRLLALLGLHDDAVGHGERLVSAAGGFFGICAVGVISGWWLQGDAALLILASMGSSAVLLFAVPHGRLSQPWPLVAGHGLSAMAGVTMALLVDDTVLAAGLAVGLAIALMHYARCIHPPGGATALTAVVGGTPIHDLGYQFVLTPVLLNTLAILVGAVLFNALFPWRRYPATLGANPGGPPAPSPAAGAPSVPAPAPAIPPREMADGGGSLRTRHSRSSALLQGRGRAPAEAPGDDSPIGVGKE